MTDLLNIRRRDQVVNRSQVRRPGADAGDPVDVLLVAATIWLVHRPTA
jgi:hypothetical protein